MLFGWNLFQAITCVENYDFDCNQDLNESQSVETLVQHYITRFIYEDIEPESHVEEKKGHGRGL